MDIQEKRWGAYRHLAGILTKAEYAEALGFLWIIEQVQDQQIFVNAVMVAWAEQFPKQALNFAHASLEGALRETAMREAAAIWSEKDPQTATEWVRARFDPSLPSPVLIDPMKPVDEIADLGGGLYATVFEKWAEKDPRAAAAWAETLPEGDIRVSAFTSSVRHWGKHNPLAAKAWVDGLPPSGSRSNAIINLSTRWVEKDPEAAAQWYSMHYDMGDVMLEWSFDAIAEWYSKSNPQGAAEWVMNLPDDLKSKDWAISVVAEEWAVRDPMAAIEWLKSSGVSSYTINQTFRGVAFRLAENSTLKAVTWAQSLISGKERENALNGVAFKWAEKDHAAAIHWFENLEDPVDKENIAEGIADAWARKDPISAAKWAESLEWSEARLKAIDQVSRKFGNKKFESAVEWAEKIQPVSSRDIALKGVILGSYDYPEECWQLSLKIRDESIQKWAMKVVAPRWIKKNPKIAKEAISHAYITEEFKKELLQDPNEDLMLFK